MNRNKTLLLLARIALRDFPGRDMDADFYEAMGFTVKRAPERNPDRRFAWSRAWAWQNPETNHWERLGNVSTSLDACRRHLPPGCAYNVGNTGPDDMPHALVTLDDEACTDVEASAPTEPVALLAAILRAKLVIAFGEPAQVAA